VNNNCARMSIDTFNLMQSSLSSSNTHTHTQQEVEVLRADNLSLRQELARLTKGTAPGSREINFEPQEESREFKF
jgi:IS1 family transposase